ncbi:MAG: TM2 domain-containing protein, partial [Opitutales bacterium]
MSEENAPQQPAAPAAKPAGAEKKIVAGILGILLGALGIHKFVLGYTKEGVIMLLVTIFG